MRPMSGDSSGAAPPPESVSSLGSLTPSDMSLLQSLGPVQSWLGQELEKCGIDAMIYTRYVLSLLLHDSYDYDLQDQENDIFLGWEKGAGKKWGKSSRRKGGTDLSLEEMKKQAAVQCLRSASDENSGVESLVEELCSKLKDIENKQKEKEKQATKKPDGSRSPESAESPSSKDQVEMYYEAFPPLSEKPVCLQEIMTVWNKARASAHTGTRTDADASSPKDCGSEGEVSKDKEAQGTAAGEERVHQRRGKKEKENRYRTDASQNKKQSKSFSGHRPRSWSSGSSEGGSSSGGNQGDAAPKGARLRHKQRSSKKGRSNGQVKLALKAEERRNAVNACGDGPTKQQHYMKKGKKPFREVRQAGEAYSRKEYMEEPLWYTEPISEYFVPLSWSKLETKYRPPEKVPGTCTTNSSLQRAYLAAGTFVDGHFVEGPEEEVEEIAVAELNGTSSHDLDDEHLSEFTHFYEVDIYQSILDPSASDAVRESRILNLIRRASDEPRDPQSGPRWESAITADSPGDDAILAQDMENIAHVWECCSSSGSEELEHESCAGDSPIFGCVTYTASAPTSCFSLFEPQHDSSAFLFPCDSLGSSRENVDSSGGPEPLGNRQSRLLIWTKNSAFEENDRCSNLSTRTCSPWSHSEETRSDAEQAGAPPDEPGCPVPPVPAAYLEEEFLDFEVGAVSGQAFGKVSKLESVCGIALEQDESATLFPGNADNGDDYSSGIIKDIWMAIGDKESGLRAEKEDDSGGNLEVPGYRHEAKEPVREKAVQLSEYHLWEGQKEDQVLAKAKVTKVDGGDYATPARPWETDAVRDGTSFILGGVYGELKTLSGSNPKDWTMVPPAVGDRGDLLQCASASDVVTIAGTDVFMNAGSCFAPGHKPLWKPLVSFGPHGQTSKGAADGLNKGFSVIFREDLLGSCGGYCGEEQGLDYPFSSLDLDNPFSQVLHVECSFEPEDMASFSPGFKPKSILCSDPDDEPFSPRLYGVNRTQYRAIRISPRTHFRPISASELSPGWCSVSDAESEREEMSLPVPGQTDLFDDSQADLKPLEEDAECEGPYYGKSELESGKFLPRLKKSGMEKSAQTSLDSQEGMAATSLPPPAERDVCVGSSTASPCVEDALPKEEPSAKPEDDRGAGMSRLLESYDVVQELPEFPLLTFGERGITSAQLEDCWWQNTLCSSMLTGPRCTESSNI